jgi:hypothetical protein
MGAQIGQMTGQMEQMAARLLHLLERMEQTPDGFEQTGGRFL